MNPTSDDEEEDFFQMLNDGHQQSSPPQLISLPQDKVQLGASVRDATLSQVSCASEVPPVQEEARHHSLNSGDESDTDHHSDYSPVNKENEFMSILASFYSTHNFANLDKVPYLAEKFNFRRWELWEQLSIKYKLSPRESRETWIQFNVSHEGVPECARRLFSFDEAFKIADESVSLRKAAWRSMLANSTHEQRDLYSKYAQEFASRESIVGLTSENNVIVRDVLRTHQELGYFQDVRIYVSLSPCLM